MYRVELSREAKRFFERASASLQRRLDTCFDRLKVNPRSGGSVKPLTGKLRGHYRYRVGDSRVIYRIDDSEQKMFVLKIAHRSDAYTQ
jgi:mRNA interferase RelE/StbE